MSTCCLRRHALDEYLSTFPETSANAMASIHTWLIVWLDVEFHIKVSFPQNFERIASFTGRIHVADEKSGAI